MKSEVNVAFTGIVSTVDSNINDLTQLLNDGLRVEKVPDAFAVASALAYQYALLRERVERIEELKFRYQRSIKETLNECWDAFGGAS